MSIALPCNEVLELSGADALRFAHAQFANDVLGLDTGRWQWNAWLSPQGRVRSLFALLRDAEARLLLWLRGGSAEALRSELLRYVFRAQVALRVRTDLFAAGGTESECRGAFGNCPDGDMLAARGDMLALRLPFGTRWLMFTPQAPAPDAAAAAHWHLQDIRAGLPQLAASLQDTLLPQWLGLERLGAFSVGKGCYPGQEVMARLHFKGGNKRWLHHITFACAALPAPGTRLRTAAAEPAIVIDSAFAQPQRAEALAVLGDSAAAGPVAGEAGALHDIQVVSRFA